jgi:hypothetical protein
MQSLGRRLGILIVQAAVVFWHMSREAHPKNQQLFHLDALGRNAAYPVTRSHEPITERQNPTTNSHSSVRQPKLQVQDVGVLQV